MYNMCVIVYQVSIIIIHFEKTSKEDTENTHTHNNTVMFIIINGCGTRTLVLACSTRVLVPIQQ